MKICILTLGCKVNKYESNSLASRLTALEHEVVDSLQESDVFVINTCAVTAEAEKKSRQTIAKCKKLSPNARIIVCGCASQHNDSQFKLRGADVVIGTAGKSNIVDIISQGSLPKMALPEAYQNEDFATQSRTRAYIKIQDGCNNFCSYCIIPYLRGRSRSRRLESILDEARVLPDDVKEIVITGINVTDFKIDGRPGLLKLLQELDELGKRIRLSSMEDTLVGEDFVRGLSQLKNFCPHFHLSLQSGSDSVLKRMNRKYTAAQFLQSVQLIRKYFPLAGITTDVIVGFPDESEEEFAQTVKFIEEVKFSSLHIFKYSRREGTVAAKLMKDMDMSIKNKRSDILEELKIRLQKDFVAQNKTAKVLVEEKEGGFYIGYTENYIKCFIKSEQDLTNQIVDVQIDQYFDGGAKATLIET